MPEISTMGNSRYLKKEELVAPITYTVKSVVNENVAMENEAPAMKWVCRFEEIDKGLVLNKTNLDNGAYVSGKTNTDDWAGEQFTLFNDQSVMFNGKRGGIRIQIQGGTGKPQPQTYAPPSVDDTNLPFLKFSKGGSGLEAGVATFKR